MKFSKGTKVRKLTFGGSNWKFKKLGGNFNILIKYLNFPLRAWQVANLEPSLFLFLPFLFTSFDSLPLVVNLCIALA